MIWSPPLCPVTVLNADIKGGRIGGSIQCQPNTITETATVTFPSAFDKVPIVALTIISETENTAYGKITAYIRDVTASGFKIMVANASETSVWPSFNWIAVRR